MFVLTDSRHGRARDGGVTAATRARLVAAATELFASHGFRGTSIRDIATRAGANIAASHYHYGSKDGLYLEVLRDQFARIRALLERRGVERSAAALPANVPRRTLERQIERRIATMLEVLLAPPPEPHGSLMLREMCDPTDALPIIVREFMEPQCREMESLLARLLPRCDRTTVRLVGFSIVGQVLFYRFNRPAVLLFLGAPAYPRGYIQRVGRHIAAFSLAGLSAYARPRRAAGRRAHAAAPKRRSRSRP